MQRTWKLLLEYEGTRYSGWQEQPNARTVAGDLRKAAEHYLNAEVELQGAGRTDAGVHALGQVAHLRARLDKAPHPEQLRRNLNTELPADIVVLTAESVPNRFHARHDAIRRSYIYQISTRKRAFEKRFVWWVKEDLNVEAMQKAATLLPGRHDFVCFRAPDPTKPDESTTVVVDDASIAVEPDMIVFRIAASHFLWRMVRRIVGVLVKRGMGEVSESQFARLLNGECDARLDVAAWTAPASGLFLERVTYPPPKP